MPNPSGLSPLQQTTLEISDDLASPEWDAFVACAPGGHHTQTSLWAQVKAPLGWQATRVIARREGRIAGGAQILYRRVPLVAGSIGYLTKGPLLPPGDPALEDLVMRQVREVARQKRIRFLIAQPPSDRQNLCEHMPGWGFHPSLMEFAPTPYTTVRLDLSESTDELLVGMRSKTRYNIRLAERHGVTVREGTGQDLGVFYRTLQATHERQNFPEYPEEYWRRFYQVFQACGYTKIFLSEYEGEVVSSVLLVNFGDAVIYKKGGWLGSQKDLHPNEILHWEAIQWAKRQGYRYYDFEGINPDAARAMQQEGSLPKSFYGSLSWFKVGFGGELQFYPGAYDYLPDPLLRWGYANVFARVKGYPVVDRLVNRLIRS